MHLQVFSWFSSILTRMVFCYRSSVIGHIQCQSRHVGFPVMHCGQLGFLFSFSIIYDIAWCMIGHLLCIDVNPGGGGILTKMDGPYTPPPPCMFLLSKLAIYWITSGARKFHQFTQSLTLYNYKMANRCAFSISFAKDYGKAYMCSLMLLWERLNRRHDPIIQASKPLVIALWNVLCLFLSFRPRPGYSLMEDMYHLCHRAFCLE